MGTQIGPSSSKLLNVEAIRAGEVLGLNFICLMCKHWSSAYEEIRKKKGRRLNEKECRKVSCNKKNCHGPDIGGIFDEYEGPLEHCMFDFCYICGARSIYFIEKRDEDSVWSIGICADHTDVLYKNEIDFRRGKENEFQNEKRN